MNEGTDFLGFDQWLCPKCGLRWYDKVEHRHSHPRCGIIRLYVKSTLDGILCFPTQIRQYSRSRAVRSPDAHRRVFVGCDSYRGTDLAARFATLNDIQVRALANVALRIPDATEHAREIVFYEADKWSWARANKHSIFQLVRL